MPFESIDNALTSIRNNKELFTSVIRDLEIKIDACYAITSDSATKVKYVHKLKFYIFLNNIFLPYFCIQDNLADDTLSKVINEQNNKNQKCAQTRIFAYSILTILKFVQDMMNNTLKKSNQHYINYYNNKHINENLLLAPTRINENQALPYINIFAQEKYIAFFAFICFHSWSGSFCHHFHRDTNYTTTAKNLKHMLEEWFNHPKKFAAFLNDSVSSLGNYDWGSDINIGTFTLKNNPQEMDSIRERFIEAQKKALGKDYGDYFVRGSKLLALAGITAGIIAVNVVSFGAALPATSHIILKIASLVAVPVTSMITGRNINTKEEGGYFDIGNEIKDTLEKKANALQARNGAIRKRNYSIW